MTDTVVTQQRVMLPEILQQIISSARPRFLVSGQNEFVTVDEESNQEFYSPMQGEILSPHVDESALVGVMKYRQRMRFFAISFCIFMIITTVFLGMMTYYYVTGLAIIHPYLMIVGSLGSLSLVATSVIDIFENNK